MATKAAFGPLFFGQSHRQPVFHNHRMSISNRPVKAACGLWFASALLVPHAAQAQTPTVYRCPGPPVLYTDTLTPAEARSRNCKPLTDLPVAVAPPVVPKAQAQPQSLPQSQPQPQPQPAAPGAAVPASAVGAAQGATAAATSGPSSPPAGTGSGFAMPPPGGTRIPVGGGAAQAAAPRPAVGGSPVAAATVPVAAGGAGAVAAAAAPAAVALADTRVRPDDQRSRDAEARRILEAELRREEARLNDALKASATAKPGERVGADTAQIRRAESDIEAIRRELGRLR